MRYVTAGLSSARGSRFNQSERRSSSVWWPIRAGLECRPIGAILPACNARRYRWQYTRPAPSFLTLSFIDAVWSGAKTRPSSGMTSQRRHPVTRAWPISRSEWLIDLTYIQVRVIDWHVTVLALTTIRGGVTSALDQSEARILLSWVPPSATRWRYKRRLTLIWYKNWAFKLPCILLASPLGDHMTRKDDKGDQPRGGETTWTNTGATRYGRGQHKTG